MSLAHDNALKPLLSLVVDIFRLFGFACAMKPNWRPVALFHMKGKYFPLPVPCFMFELQNDMQTSSQIWSLLGIVQEASKVVGLA